MNSKSDSNEKQPGDFSLSISTRLKQLRSEMGLSLDKAASLTGVSKAMLGQIERQESSPTIATLWKIATGLNGSFSSFIAPNTQSEFDVNHGFIHDPNMQVKTLFPFDVNKGFEVFEITLTHQHEQCSSAHQSGVTEHIHCIEGKLTLWQGDERKTISAGEQGLLKADQAHGYKDESGRTRFINIIHYPVL
ncbi:XRE family transcriptional regulator [Alteromonas sp. 1_MG-2023]|uniref:helix-turn-helix domain-containing protein n=1 Tax=Alteromonas sp. 1_MG-2023 TaxID=3062669 RepID=UPI0026E3A9C5|nr:XRE family transcriptional regulator [Alteromonas sp. 1_MG-2023]MDO6565686.1 XRE family transcriptional regulator [Alteromonas sp. 1_MG-2023]